MNVRSHQKSSGSAGRASPSTRCPEQVVAMNQEKLRQVGSCWEAATSKQQALTWPLSVMFESLSRSIIVDGTAAWNAGSWPTMPNARVRFRICFWSDHCAFIQERGLKTKGKLSQFE